jgi:hypothetical protein
MGTHPLHHLIYTNAPGSDGTGYRVVRSESTWPSEQSQRVIAWVKSFDLRQLKTDQRGFATKCFRITDKPHVCLAVTLAEFARDTHGRTGGSLTHVLATPVNEGNDNGHHIVALMDKADALQCPQVEDAQRLGIYLEKYTQDSTVTVAPPSIAELQRLGTENLKKLLLVALAGTVFRNAITLEVDEPARALAYGAGALPPRLRLAFSWGCGILVPGLPNFISTTTAGEKLTMRHQNAEKYFEWLWHQLNSGDSALLDQLWSEWDIKSWDALIRRI